MIYYHGKRAASEVLDNLPDQVREMRRQLRDVARAVEDLNSHVRDLLEARRREMAVPPAEEEEVESARFSPRTLKSLRRRFDLTQHELAELLEVSPVTVTSWETGKSRPRSSNLAQIITLRSMGEEEVNEALGREQVPSEVSPSEIKRLRSKFNLTQAELAELLGISGAAVTSWETGKTRPSRENRQALMELRETDRDEINRRLSRETPSGGGAPELGGTASEVTPDDIRTIRERLGLTQRELADRLGVSVNTISNWETGRSSPRRRSLEMLRSL
jgi:DNA-binding transcriptional regulator YiaG